VTAFPTAHAEWALKRLSARTAEYLHSTPMPILGGRHLSEPIAPRHANALVDFVAVAEAFCVARLISLGATGDVNTWEKRAKALSTRAIDVNLFSDWPSLMGFVEVRNAIQHGLGRLTERQLGKHKAQIRGWLTAAAVPLNGDQVILRSEDVTRCGQVCGRFIRWLDATAPPPVR
jgi:hypothetical protein